MNALPAHKILDMQRKILGVIYEIPRTEENIGAIIDAGISCSGFVNTAIVVGECPYGHQAGYTETDGDQKYYHMGCDSSGCEHHGRWTYIMETLPDDANVSEAKLVQLSAWARP